MPKKAEATIKELRLTMVYTDGSEVEVGNVEWIEDHLSSKGKPLQTTSRGFTVSKKLPEGLYQVSINGYIR